MPTQNEINRRPLLILGTLTLAQEVADVVSDIPDVCVTGYVENMDRTRCAQFINGLPVYWIDEVSTVAASHAAMCGIATTLRSRFTDQIDALGLPFATLVHPTAHVSCTTQLGTGTLVGAGVIVGSHSRLSRHVLVNRGALIGHHTSIGDFVTVQPGANIAGACEIGTATYVGMGAVIIDHIKVGKHSIIGAGAVVIEEVPDCVMVAGVPAKIVKRGIPGK